LRSLALSHQNPQRITKHQNQRFTKHHHQSIGRLPTSILVNQLTHQHVCTDAIAAVIAIIEARGYQSS
jgi:hypothetical protein